ncbi:MAG: PKD domain-containing protein, partial [bacterium]|nr:PKD domain-containing protein [bacterium]
MQKLKVFLCILLVVFMTSALTAKGDSNKVTLVSSSNDEIVLKFQIDSFDFKRVQTPNGEELILVAPNTSRLLKKKKPDLTRLAVPVIIPNTGKMRLKVIDSKFIELDHIKIAPSKGVITRDKDPRSIPYKYGSTYKKDAYYPKSLTDMGTPYISRDYRGQTVYLYPFQYNPVRNILRVYKEVTVRLKRKNKEGKNELIQTESVTGLSPEFRNVYSRHFINYPQTEYTALPDDFGRMLIVSYGSFMDEMADFVSWKQSIGYTVEMVDYAGIGSASALKTYVADYYNTNGLTYLLLVGDHAQVATSSTSAGDSDTNYGYIVGDDHYLDIFVGRFSAETSADVTTQVDRSIYYERDLASSAAWFKKAVGMGSSEGPGHNNEYDYQHINNILSDLSGDGYTTSTCHQSSGSAATMSSLINAGTGTIFYAGHGSANSWYTTSWSYTSSNVNALSNNNMLPFIFNVACVVGDFKNNTCYSEVWQRATYNGNPAGALVNCGSTINQSWIPPMTAQDEMADIMVAGSQRTFGGVYVNGMFKMIDDHGTDGQNMADTWTCFGDASIQIRMPDAPNGPNSGPVTDPPVANFSVSTTTVETGSSVSFSDLSTNSPSSWSWSFSGGTPSTSTAQNPSVTYNTVGTYDVTLTATNSYGNDGETKTGYITVTDQVISYCASSGNDYSYEWIAGVEVGNLNNTSGAAGYTDFTSESAALTAGSVVSVNLTPGFASSTYTEYWTIRIDYNADGDFDDSDEEVFNGSGTSAVSGTFTVPSSASGSKRMRVYMSYSSAAASCGSFTYGEAEDYTVDITAGTVQAPVAAFTASATTVTVGDSVSFTDQSSNAPTSWAWSFAGGTPTSSTSQNPSVTYNTAGSYQVSLTASNSGGSDDEIKAAYITVNDQVIQYCTASGDNLSYEWIAGVDVGFISNSTGASSSGYGDYTSITGSLAKGGSVSVSLAPGFASSSYTEYWTIWIDYNGDGDFADSGEEVFSGSGSSTVSGSFTVSSSASSGNTRMRVAMKYSSAASSCGTFTYGEVEDYTV